VWKGTDAGSPEKMTQVFARGFDPARAAAAGTLASRVTNEIPALQGGRNPLLPLNASSYFAGNPGGKRIALGDGLLDVNNPRGDLHARPMTYAPAWPPPGSRTPPAAGRTRLPAESPMVMAATGADAILK
jgi:hypothetical protein